MFFLNLVPKNSQKYPQMKVRLTTGSNYFVIEKNVLTTAFYIHVEYMMFPFRKSEYQGVKNHFGDLFHVVH